MEKSPARNVGPVDRFFSELGPGLITGCADDDPSGISTYSIAGAAAGYSFLWTALLSLPMMAAVQLMCGRLGMVTGHGLAGAVRMHYPRWILWGACLLLITANLFNIAADLGGMADATSMITGTGSLVWTPLYALSILVFLIWSSYRKLARFFKWITLVLGAYIAAAFLVRVEWRQAVLASLIPRMNWSREYISILVGILGTTISPYLFFWQASQEVEEERADGRLGKNTTGTDLRRLRRDVFTGAMVSNLVMYFIMVTTAATLHRHGIINVATTRQAAEALRPLAGPAAYALFSVGLIGTGMLGVPVLAGSCAYAIAEAASWRGSLDQKPHRAKGFYWVLSLAVLIGLAIQYAGLDAMRMLFWSAVVNGILAPPLILLILLLTSNPAVMGRRVNSPLLRILGWLTFAAMSAAAFAMFAT